MSESLPVLFSTERSIYSSLPAMFAGTPVPVVVGQRFTYSNRIWEAKNSGTVTTYPPSPDAYIATRHAEDATYASFVVSGVSFQDVTGDIRLGWEYAVSVYYGLLRVNNPSMTSSLSPQRPTLANNMVLFDSDSVMETKRSHGSTERDSGICMWGYWDFSNEVVYGPFTGGASITVCGMPSESLSISWISVDASDPDLPPKKGARLWMKESISTSPMFIGGLGYMEGFIVDISAPARFSGATRTLCYIWFHDCDFIVKSTLDTAVEGRYNVLGRTPTTPSVYIDVFFSDSNIELKDGGSFSVCGNFHFEKCVLIHNTSGAFFSALEGVTHITFTGSDFSQVPISNPIASVATTCPYLHVKFDSCTGLRSAHIVPPALDGGTSFFIEVIGGWLDGEYDPHRYIAYTEFYSVSVSNDVYPLSSVPSPRGGLLSMRYTTTDWLEEGFSFCALHHFNAWSSPGVLRISVEILLPSGVVPTIDSLWVDFGVCGGDAVEVWSSKAANVEFAIDTQSVWVNKGDYVAYTCTNVFLQAIPGAITGTLYCSIPNAVIYVRPNLDITVVGTI